MNQGVLSRRDLLQSASALAAGPLLGAALAENPAQADSTEKPVRKKTLLAIGAHLDDPEIGAAGTLAKAVKNGHRVVVVITCGQFATWRVTRGRDKEIREKLAAHAKTMGIEKRFLNFGYQQIADDLSLMKEFAEIVVELEPDIAFIHSRFERDRSPSDHSTVGILAERALRNADTILGRDLPAYSHRRPEVYAYEVYPQTSFVPDVFVDIRDVLKETLEAVNYFGTDLYQSPAWPNAGRTDAVIRVLAEGWEVPLTHYAEMKYAMAVFRGYQSGTRFAEGFKALDHAVLGRRVLEEVIA